MSATQIPEALPPHYRCDCVPNLGPAHCHRCSRLSDTHVEWESAPCKSMVASAVYETLLLLGEEEEMLTISEAFDAVQLAKLTASPSSDRTDITKKEG